jgi:hypothetical protein
MADWSRRRALSAIACGLTVGLAGCNDAADEETPTDPLHRPVEDYETRHVRSDDTAALWTTGESPSDREVRRRYTYLSGDDPLSDVQFNTDAEAGATLESFVTATDFERESVYLYAGTVSECHEVHIANVYRQEDGVHAYVCRTVRPADVDCSTGTDHAVAIAIRLPFALKGPGFSQGLGMRTNCVARPAAVDFDSVTPGNATVEDATDENATDSGALAPPGGED